MSANDLVDEGDDAARTVAHQVERLGGEQTFKRRKPVDRRDLALEAFDDQGQESRLVLDAIGDDERLRRDRRRQRQSAGEELSGEFRHRAKAGRHRVRRHKVDGQAAAMAVADQNTSIEAAAGEMRQGEPGCLQRNGDVERQ